MAIAIRGTTPGVTTTASDPISLTLNGARQPNTNDVLIIIHCNDYYAMADMPSPTVGGSSNGVNPITNGSFDIGDLDGHAKSYTYVAGSTGDLTVAVDETSTADEEKGLIVYVLSGVDTTTPIDAAANTFDSVNALSHPAPSVSPTSTDAYLICHLNSGATDGGANTPPGSMAEQYDAVFAGALTYTGATEQLSASGATGTRTFTSANLIRYGMLSIAVKTGGGAPPPELEEGPQVNVTRSNNRFA